MQYDNIFTGVNLKTDAVICIVKSVGFEIIEIKNITVVIITLFLTIILLLVIFLIIVLILYCIRRKKVLIKHGPRVAPALVAAVMGRVSVV